MKQIAYCILFLLLTAVLSKDFEPHEMRFGKDIENSLNQQSWAFAEDAEAVFLFKNVEFTYRVISEELSLVETHHTRIKLLNQNASDLADVKLYYKRSDRDENIRQIKASAYYLEDGKVEEYKLKKKDIFEKKLDDDYSEISFAIPNVKEGTVFEYSYVQENKGQYTPPTFYFSQDHPVAYSQVQIDVPEWFDFSQYTRGYDPFVYTSVVPSNIDLGAGYGKPGSSTNTYGKTNLDAFKDESYVANANDFKEQIQFRLNSVKYPGRERQILNTTWEKLNENILEWEYTDQQKNKKLIEETFYSFANMGMSEMEKIRAIYEYVVSGIETEKDGWIFPDSTPKKTLKDKTGTVSEVNMLLINFLQTVGIEAYPLLISTRTDGYIDKIYPTMRAFSYPVAYVKTESGKEIILNASSKYRPYYLPRMGDFNIEGWLVDEENYGWIDVEQLTPNSLKHYDITATLLEDGTYSGKVEVSSSNYLSISDRYNIDEDGVEERFIDLYNGDGDLIMEDTKSGDTNENYANFSFEGKFTLADHAQSLNEFIYFNPIIFEIMQENPFTKPKRNYPVDFQHPYKYIYTITVELPQGYQLEEAPRPVKVSLFDDAQFMIVAEEKDGVLEIQYTEEFNSTVIQPNKYSMLQEYFDKLIEETSKQYTLKKIDENGI